MLSNSFTPKFCLVDEKIKWKVKHIFLLSLRCKKELKISHFLFQSLAVLRGKKRKRKRGKYSHWMLICFCLEGPANRREGRRDFWLTRLLSLSSQSIRCFWEGIRQPKTKSLYWVVALQLKFLTSLHALHQDSVNIHKQI